MSNIEREKERQEMINLMDYYKSLDDRNKEKEEIRTKIIKEYYPLVSQYIGAYSKRYDVSEDDLHSYAAVGLIHGIDSFDSKKHKNLESHIKMYIVNEINRGIDEIFKINNRQEFTGKVNNSYSVDYDGKVIKEEVKVKVNELLETLKPVEKEFIRQRLGFDDEISKTPEKVGQILNDKGHSIDVAYAGAFESRILKKLRESEIAKSLDDETKEDAFRGPSYRT